MTVQADHPPLGCLSDEAVASSVDMFSWWWISPVAEFWILVLLVGMCVHAVHPFEGPDGSLGLFGAVYIWYCFLS